jgi:DNA-binding NarL/FixJ family response regulator
MGAAQTWRAVYDEPSKIFAPFGAPEVLAAQKSLGSARWSSELAWGADLTGARSGQLAHDVLDRLSEVVRPSPAGLTGREVDVLRLVAEGLSNPAIADRLVLSPRTVHAHLRSIFTKLDVTSRTAAAHQAQRFHLV